MGVTSGPRLASTDSLVLSLDAMSAKSFAGEPTSNLCTSHISDGAIAFGAAGTNSPMGLTVTAEYATETPFGNTAYKLTFAAGGSYGTGYAAERATTSSWTVDKAKTYSYGIWIAFNNDYCKYRFEVVGAIYSYITGSNGMATFHGVGGKAYIDAGGKRWYHYGRTAQSIGSSGSASEFWTIFRNTATLAEECTLWVCGPQFEEGSSFTPFTSTSRSATAAWKDVSGKGNHGTFSADDFGNADDVSLYKKGQILLPTSTDNIVTSPAAINFDGTNDYVSTSGGDYSLSGDQTFEVWFQIKGGPDSPAGILVQHDHAVPANFGINHVGSNKLGPSISYTDGSREYDSKTTTTTFSHDTLYHVALVYHSSANKIIWYVNGEEDKQYTLSKTPAFGAEPFALGRWSTTYNDYYFDGHIYKASVYAIALSHVQIRQNFNQQRSRFGK